jgi:hypothetical protein
VNRFLLIAAASLLLAAPAYAYDNKALGFQLNEYAQTENIMICAQQDCLTFVPVGNGKTYTEESGKCTLTMDYVTQDFATGKTEFDFMLTLSAQVVQVIKGDEACQLMQQEPQQLRSLTGIYVN